LLSGKSLLDQTSITFAAHNLRPRDVVLCAGHLEFLVMLARSQESRKNVRRRMHRDAQVVFEGHEHPVDCVVHDISNGGARLTFAAPLAALPSTFILVLLKDSVQRQCEAVWNDRGVVGVKFVSRWLDVKHPSACLQKPQARGPREPKSIA
jgi:hypothetical protein